jgi:hypothetical protein
VDVKIENPETTELIHAKIEKKMHKEAQAFKPSCTNTKFINTTRKKEEGNE